MPSSFCIVFVYAVECQGFLAFFLPGKAEVKHVGHLSGNYNNLISQSTQNHTSVLQDPETGRRSEYTKPHLYPTRPGNRSPVRVHKTTPLSYKTRKQVAGQSTQNHTSVLQDPETGRRSEYTKPHLCPTRPGNRSPVRVHKTTPLSYKARKQVAGQSTQNHTSVLQDPETGRRSEYTKPHLYPTRPSDYQQITSRNVNSKVHSFLLN